MVIKRARRQVFHNIMRGLGVGLFVATGLSVWITFLRLWQGTAPFDRAGTQYGVTVVVYYVAFSLGGIVVGALLPLRRWALGSMLLGMLFVGPVYASFVFLDASPQDRFSRWNVFVTLAATVIGGGLLGLWMWWGEQRGRR